MTLRLSPLDIAMGIAVALTWGMGLVFAKAAIEHFPPILLMAFRFTVTAAAMVWFVKIPRQHFKSLFWIAIVSAAIQYSLTFTGLKGLDASITAIVVQLEVPFLVILGAVFLKEQVSFRKWIGILFAFAGVALISGEPKLNDAWVSLLLVVSGGFTWAVGQVMIRALKDIDGMTLVAWVAVFAAPQLFIMSALVETDQVQAVQTAGPVVWGAVLYLGLVMTAFGYGIWYTLVRKHPVSMVAPFLLLLPVFSVLGGVFVLGETLTGLIWVGGALVIAGVSFIVVEKKKN